MGAACEESETIEKSTTTVAGDSDSSYATTNSQVSGVEEGDIIKNDGTYLYCLTGGNTIFMLKQTKDSGEKISEIVLEETISEF